MLQCGLLTKLAFGRRASLGLCVCDTLNEQIGKDGKMVISTIFVAIAVFYDDLAHDKELQDHLHQAWGYFSLRMMPLDDLDLFLHDFEDFPAR
eukprot:645046-Hanusia_phi.AAC.2